MKKIFLLIPILTVSVLIFSCKKDKVPEIAVIPTGTCIDTISFNQIIKPLIEQGCAISGCHDAMTSQSGYNFTGYQNISSLSDPMIGTIRYDPGHSPMPKFAPKFADSLIQKIECWIAQGKLNN